MHLTQDIDIFFNKSEKHQVRIENLNQIDTPIQTIPWRPITEIC